MDSHMAASDENIFDITHTLDFLRSSPDLQLILKPHPDRKTVAEEIKTTVELKIESEVAAAIWKREALKYEEKLRLAELNFWIRRTTKKMAEMCGNVYSAMVKFKLARDQNVFTLVASRFFDTQEVLYLSAKSTQGLALT